MDGAAVQDRTGDGGVAGARAVVVAVGGEPAADAVRAGLNGLSDRVEVVGTTNYLSALAVVASRREVAAVLGPLEGPSKLMPKLVRSMRELSPGVRLYVRLPSGRESEGAAALAAGFDGYVLEPLTAEELAMVVALPSEGRASDAAGRGASDASEAASVVEVGVGELGDVDLVEAVLRGQYEATRMACRLIEQQGGPTGVAVARDRSAVPAGRACVTIERGGAEVGWLHAEGGDEEELSRWAPWLASWLTLDRQFSGLKRLALTDELTRAWNRRYFDRFLKRVIDHAQDDRSQVTLLVFDIDNFKQYNDRYGHAAGDEILREVAKLMRSVVREHDVVARIGGDEFAVIFWDAEPSRTEGGLSPHPTDVLDCAKRFQAAICRHEFPKLLDEQPGTLTVSGGLASYPWDGRTPTELLSRADAMALRSKQQGKNAIKMGPGAISRCELGAGRGGEGG
ncbi:MAG: GGDEF domain-containing protein [Planctomycetota bacterium]